MPKHLTRSRMVTFSSSTLRYKFWTVSNATLAYLHAPLGFIPSKDVGVGVGRKWLKAQLKGKVNKECSSSTALRGEICG
ncbi:unnamed protein product [Sphenostylis stenocarpa]|uniref:Uncharacterized protein n=1 Tax=Sphenostylis stenocarpa TaxID=92480 RepID=A0AA86V4B8_9FABA|nr:unnamed protein product [Sphenostylis stenocarpa]